MAFWVYDLKQLLNIKNLVISRNSDVEQLFNFLTYLIFGASYYMKQSRYKIWPKFLLVSIVLVMILGIIISKFMKKPETEMLDGMEVPIMNNFEYDLNF